MNEYYHLSYENPIRVYKHINGDFYLYSNHEHCWKLVSYNVSKSLLDPSYWTQITKEAAFEHIFLNESVDCSS